MKKSHWIPGICIFAIVNFVLASLNLFLIFFLLTSPEASKSMDVFLLLSFYIVCLVVMGIGLLRLNRWWGYWFSHFVAVVALVTGGLSPAFDLGIIYVMIVLLFLNLKYRHLFTSKKSCNE